MLLLRYWQKKNASSYARNHRNLLLKVRLYKTRSTLSQLLSVCWSVVAPLAVGTLLIVALLIVVVLTATGIARIARAAIVALTVVVGCARVGISVVGRRRFLGLFAWRCLVIAKMKDFMRIAQQPRLEVEIFLPWRLLLVFLRLLENRLKRLLCILQLLHWASEVFQELNLSLGE